MMFFINKLMSCICKQQCRHSSSFRKSCSDIEEMVSLCVLGSGAMGSGGSVSLQLSPIRQGHAVHNNGTRYLFNSGEGVSYSNLERTEVYLTNSSWKNISGLGKIILKPYFSSLDKPFTVFGPNKYPDYVKEIYSGVLKNRIREHELNIISEHKYFEKEDFTMQAIPIAPSGEENTASEQNLVIAYIVHPNLQKGRIHDSTLKKHDLEGVEAVDIKKIVDGVPITLPNGQCITQNDISVNLSPRRCFIVLEIPHEEYLDGLLEEKSFYSLQADEATSTGDHPSVIVHFSPHNVLHDPRYKKWVNKFLPSTQHIIINEQNSSLGQTAGLKLPKLLRNIYPNSFPELKSEVRPIDGVESSIDSVDSSVESFIDSEMGRQLESKLLSEEYSFKGKTYLPNTLSQFCFGPEVKLLSPEDVEGTFMDRLKKPSVHEALKDFGAIMKKMQDLPSSAGSYPEIIFLGTGSSESSIYRNASSILINISEDRCILLDCGSNTCFQMARLHGVDGTDELLRKLVYVFISHAHFDHFGGLASLLRLREEAFKKKNLPIRELYISAPVWVRQHLWAFNDGCHDVLKHCVLMENNRLSRILGRFDPELNRTVCAATNLLDVNVVFVPHCHESYAFSMLHRDGWKLTYSGDCSPNENLIIMGKESSVLIHEATMSDSNAKRAELANHSTTSGAIEAGRLMEADHVILTHFSKSEGIFPFREEGYPSNVTLAFDFMKVTLDDLPILPNLYPVLPNLFE